MTDQFRPSSSTNRMKSSEYFKSTQVHLIDVKVIKVIIFRGKKRYYVVFGSKIPIS